MKSKRKVKLGAALKVGDVFTIEANYVVNPGPLMSPVCSHLLRDEVKDAARDYAVNGLTRLAQRLVIVSRSLSEDGRNALSDIADMRQILNECERFAKAINDLTPKG